MYKTSTKWKKLIERETKCKIPCTKGKKRIKVLSGMYKTSTKEKKGETKNNTSK